MATRSQGMGTVPRTHSPLFRKKPDSRSHLAKVESKKQPASTKLNAIMEAYSVLPLSDSGLVDAREPTRETILALVYMAMLTCGRISHELAYKSVKCLLEAGFQDADKLQNSPSQGRTKTLTKGGYTRYREKTATALGELADLVKNIYGISLGC